jgi:hypothetical protein
MELWARLGAEPPGRGPDRVLPLVTGLRGFVTDAVERLGGQIGLVHDGTRPQVLAILTPSEDSLGPAGCVWIGRARTRALIFSPQNIAGVLEMKTVPGLGAGGLGPRLIVDTPVAAFEVHLDQYSRIRVPIRLEAGVNHAEIGFPDLDRKVTDRRRLCVARFEIGSIEIEGGAPGAQTHATK